MATHFTQVNQEVHNYMTQDVPHSLHGNNSAQSIKARNRIFQLSSTSQSQTSGGLILFNIPASNYSITRGSMAIRMKVTITGTAIGVAAPADGTHTVGFSGPGALAGTLYSAVPALGSGYSVFSRATLYGANSAVIEACNYLNDNETLMLAHNSNASWLSTDANINMGVGGLFTYAADHLSAQIDLVLPLPLSFFNSSTIDVPMYLLSAPLTLQLDLASVSRAIFAGSAAAGVTDYTVSQTYLVYQAVELPNAFIEAQRMAVKSSPFVMNLLNSMSVQVPASILSSYSLGLNASSVRACFVLPSNSATYSSTAQLQYIRDTVDSNVAPIFSGSGTNAILFVDGNQVNSAIYDTPAMIFSQLKQALHHNQQGAMIYPSICTKATFLTNYYAIGFDLTNFSDESTIFSGTPCTTLNLQLTGYGTVGANYLYTIIVLYDVLIAIEENGTIQVKR